MSLLEYGISCTSVFISLAAVVNRYYPFSFIGNITLSKDAITETDYILSATQFSKENMVAVSFLQFPFSCL